MLILSRISLRESEFRSTAIWASPTVIAPAAVEPRIAPSGSVSLLTLALVAPLPPGLRIAPVASLATLAVRAWATLSKALFEPSSTPRLSRTLPTSTKSLVPSMSRRNSLLPASFVDVRMVADTPAMPALSIFASMALSESAPRSISTSCPAI